MNSTPIIIIEGIDGVWKTTLAQWLARTLNGVYYKTPGCRTSEERAQFDVAGIQVQDRFNFYVDACREDLIRIQEINNKGKVVCCDRFIWSTIIHHQAMDEQIDVGKAKHLETRIKNKIEILLTANPEIIRERLSKRNTQTQFEQNERLYIRTQAMFRQRIWIDLIIDNTDCTEQDTLLKALSFIQR